ncbi:MAG: hypothetical protein NVS3B17_05040 [Vulcanimicrobiaceae bacterium]
MWEYHERVGDDADVPRKSDREPAYLQPQDDRQRGESGVRAEHGFGGQTKRCDAPARGREDRDSERDEIGARCARHVVCVESHARLQRGVRAREAYDDRVREQQRVRNPHRQS